MKYTIDAKKAKKIKELELYQKEVKMTMKIENEVTKLIHYHKNEDENEACIRRQKLLEKVRAKLRNKTAQTLEAEAEVQEDVLSMFDDHKKASNKKIDKLRRIDEVRVH